MLETGGSLEPGTAAVVQALLEPNDLAIYVGAHVGTLAIAMARSVAPHGRVLAIQAVSKVGGFATDGFDDVCGREILLRRGRLKR